MIPILLLDCSEELLKRLQKQGYDADAGTVGFQTGARYLPSQVYERTIFIYNPTSFFRKDGGEIQLDDIHNSTPQFAIEKLKERIENGGTCLIFVNPLSKFQKNQNAAYDWIPYMPLIVPTHDKVIISNSFSNYPDSAWELLAPIINKHEMDLPVLWKIKSPPRAPYTNDVFVLMSNNQSDVLGVLILRGSGRLIILPKFKSNDEIIEIFLDRVLPNMYSLKTKVSLVDQYESPAERVTAEKLGELQLQRKYVESQLTAKRSELQSARREKSRIIGADETAKRILIYHDIAVRQDSVALFYLYKILEILENKYAGEAEAIKALGCSAEWKHVKRSANESYGDIRHAPKPGDVIKKWTREEIKKSFSDTEKVVLSYFEVLFTAESPGKVADKSAAS
jgi:hypothetical protein